MSGANEHPHAGSPVVRGGAPLDTADAALLLLHGRGATAEGILGLGRALELGRVALIAPQAAGRQWYPRSFLEPTERNQPWLDSALRRVGELIDEIVAAGLPHAKIVVAGFSQGACLASESVARAPRRYGGVAALSGGLIGAELDEARYPDGLAGTPAFFGCSDVDAHIPESRVHESAAILGARGAEVDTRIYPGMAHTVNDEEVGVLRAMVEAARDG